MALAFSRRLMEGDSCSDTLLGEVGNQGVRLTVVGEGEVVLGPGDGHEEQGALVAELAQRLGAGVQLGIAVEPGDEDVREV